MIKKLILLVVGIMMAALFATYAADAVWIFKVRYAPGSMPEEEEERRYGGKSFYIYDRYII